MPKSQRRTVEICCLGRTAWQALFLFTFAASPPFLINLRPCLGCCFGEQKYSSRCHMNETNRFNVSYCSDPLFKLRVLKQATVEKCDICLLNENNPLRYGEFVEKVYKTQRKIRAHYFCLVRENGNTVAVACSYSKPHSSLLVLALRHQHSPERFNTGRHRRV